MPVEDHPLHPHGVRVGEYRASCFNRTGFEEGYWAKDGITINGYNEGSYRMVWISHTMSTKCRQIVKLPECECCKAPKDVEYIERMTKLV